MMMHLSKKLVRIAGSAITLILCVGASVNAAAEPKGLSEAGVLTICNSTSNYPPMYMEDAAGNLVGVEIEMAKAVAKDWGVTPKFNRMAFRGLVPALAAGRCDLLWSSLNMTPERMATLDAVPYKTSGLSLLVKAGNPLGIKNSNDLSGRRVAVAQSTSQAIEAANLSAKFEKAGEAPVKIQTYPNNTGPVAAVLDGKADAMMETDTYGAYIVSQNKDTMEAVANAFPQTARVAVFLKKNSALKEPLVDTIRRLDNDGTMAKILTKYGLSPTVIVKP